MNNIREHTKKSKNALKGRKSGIQPQPPQKQEQKNGTHTSKTHSFFICRKREVGKKKYQIGEKKVRYRGREKIWSTFFFHIYM